MKRVVYWSLGLWSVSGMALRSEHIRMNDVWYNDIRKSLMKTPWDTRKEYDFKIDTFRFKDRNTIWIQGVQFNTSIIDEYMDTIPHPNKKYTTFEKILQAIFLGPFYVTFFDETPEDPEDFEDFFKKNTKFCEIFEPENIQEKRRQDKIQREKEKERKKLQNVVSHTRRIRKRKKKKKQLYYFQKNKDDYKTKDTIVFGNSSRTIYRSINHKTWEDLFVCDVVLGKVKQTNSYIRMNKDELYGENFDSIEKSDVTVIFDPDQVIQCQRVNIEDREQEFLKRIQESKPKTVYHETDVECALSIIESEQMKPGDGGLAGGGIYFAHIPKETQYKAHRKGVMLECEVLLGRMFTTKQGDDKLTKQELWMNGYDSTFISKRWSGVEYVAYDPRQVRRCKIISVSQ